MYVYIFLRYIFTILLACGFSLIHTGVQTSCKKNARTKGPCRVDPRCESPPARIHVEGDLRAHSRVLFARIFLSGKRLVVIYLGLHHVQYTDLSLDSSSLSQGLSSKRKRKETGWGFRCLFSLPTFLPFPAERLEQAKSLEDKLTLTYNYNLKQINEMLTLEKLYCHKFPKMTLSGFNLVKPRVGGGGRGQF